MESEWSLNRLPVISFKTKLHLKFAFRPCSRTHIAAISHFVRAHGLEARIQEEPLNLTQSSQMAADASCYLKRPERRCIRLHRDISSRSVFSSSTPHSQVIRLWHWCRESTRRQVVALSLQWCPTAGVRHVAFKENCFFFHDVGAVTLTSWVSRSECGVYLLPLRHSKVCGWLVCLVIKQQGVPGRTPRCLTAFPPL